MSKFTLRIPNSVPISLSPSRLQTLYPLPTSLSSSHLTPIPLQQVSITKAFHHYAYLYVKYIQILIKLSQCYDQMTHTQKRIDVQQILQLVVIRIIELKHLLVKWHPPHPDVRSTPIEKSFPWEYINLDAVLVDLKLPPEALEIPIAKCFAEEHLDTIQQRDRVRRIGIVSSFSQSTKIARPKLCKAQTRRRYYFPSMRLGNLSKGS